MQFLSLSWQQLHKDTYRLAKKIEKTNKKFDLIVTIAMGGYDGCSYTLRFPKPSGRLFHYLKL